jgi:hypothetical protein
MTAPAWASLTAVSNCGSSISCSVPVGDDLVDGVPVGFLVVRGEVLNLGDDPLALDALDVGVPDLAAQVGILAIALILAAVLRHPRDVHVRTLDQAVTQGRRPRCR